MWVTRRQTIERGNFDELEYWKYTQPKLHLSNWLMVISAASE